MPVLEGVGVRDRVKRHARYITRQKNDGRYSKPTCAKVKRVCRRAICVPRRAIGNEPSLHAGASKKQNFVFISHDIVFSSEPWLVVPCFIRFECLFPFALPCVFPFGSAPLASLFFQPCSNPRCAELSDDDLSGLWLLDGGSTDGSVVGLTDNETNELVVADQDVNRADTTVILSAAGRVGCVADVNALGNAGGTESDAESSARSEGDNFVGAIAGANRDPILDVYPGPIPDHVLEKFEDEGVDARVYAMFEAISGTVVGVNGEAVADGYEVEISDLNNVAIEAPKEGALGGTVEGASTRSLRNMGVSDDSGESVGGGIAPDAVECVALAAASGDATDSEQAHVRGTVPDPLETAVVVAVSDDAMHEAVWEDEEAQPTLAGAMEQLGTLTAGLHECQDQARTLGELRTLTAEKKTDKKKEEGREKVEEEGEEELRNRRVGGRGANKSSCPRAPSHGRLDRVAAAAAGAVEGAEAGASAGASVGVLAGASAGAAAGEAAAMSVLAAAAAADARAVSAEARAVVAERALAAAEASAISVSAAAAEAATTTAAEAAVGEELVATTEATVMKDNAAASKSVNNADKAAQRSRGFLLLEGINRRRCQRKTFAAFGTLRCAASAAVGKELAVVEAAAEAEAAAAAVEEAVAREREKAERIAEEAKVSGEKIIGVAKAVAHAAAAATMEEAAAAAATVAVEAGAKEAAAVATLAKAEAKAAEIVEAAVEERTKAKKVLAEANLKAKEVEMSASAVAETAAVATAEKEAAAAALASAVKKEAAVSETVAKAAAEAAVVAAAMKTRVKDAECARVVAESSAAKALEEKNAQVERHRIVLHETKKSMQVFYRRKMSVLKAEVLTLRRAAAVAARREREKEEEKQRDMAAEQFSGGGAAPADDPVDLGGRGAEVGGRGGGRGALKNAGQQYIHGEEQKDQDVVRDEEEYQEGGETGRIGVVVEQLGSERKTGAEESIVTAENAVFEQWGDTAGVAREVRKVRGIYGKEG